VEATGIRLAIQWEKSKERVPTKRMRTQSPRLMLENFSAQKVRLFDAGGS